MGQINDKQHKMFDYITVYADSEDEALEKAEHKIINHPYYNEIYDGCEITGVVSYQLNCNEQPYYGILLPSDIQTTKENQNMAYFNVNWNEYTDQLASIAAPEIWSNDTYPNNGILANYMVHTFEKLKSEKNIIITKEYGLFNTGLFTDFYEPIFAYATEKQPVSFMTPYELGNVNIDQYPERANYFKDPSLLLFDWHYQINIHYKHILKDINNIKRIPKNIQDDKNILNNLNGSIETMKKRVSANYKIAIPQYFDKKIQLLLPLCLETDNIPDLALVVTKVGDVYQGHTCLTLDMAYNNARLIAKPESNWLSTNNVVK